MGAVKILYRGHVFCLGSVSVRGVERGGVGKRLGVVQWNLDLTKCQGTGKLVCYVEGSSYRGSFSYITLLRG